MREKAGLLLVGIEVLAERALDSETFGVFLYGLLMLLIGVVIGAAFS